VFVGVVQIVVDRFSTYRRWSIYVSLWLHVVLLRSFIMYLFYCWATIVIEEHWHSINC